MARRFGSLRRLILYITMVSRDGLPFQGTSLQSPQQGSTKHHFKTPRCPGLLSPYKRAGRDPTKENGEQAGHKIEINISSNHLCTLFPLFETWAHHPLSQACNPYTSTSVQGNT
jgi:hypothetical protein